MANGHGGYRRPSNPAPVSGPGRLARRTDGRQPVMALPDAKYGENAAYISAQQGAPLPQAGGPPSPASSMIHSSSSAGSGAGAGPAGPSMPAPLAAGSQRPREPVTAGVPIGAGPGPEVLTPRAPQRLTEVIAAYAGGDLTGVLRDLYTEAARQGL